eukprot:468788-Pyramimonas_sp.AAC.1
MREAWVARAWGRGGHAFPGPVFSSITGGRWLLPPSARLRDLLSRASSKLRIRISLLRGLPGAFLFSDCLPEGSLLARGPDFRVAPLGSCYPGLEGTRDDGVILRSRCVAKVVVGVGGADVR